jgi:short-subunit dehydrogenase
MKGAGKKALVTGASRGIGKAIAAALAGDGYEVIGTSRNPDAIPPEERLPGVRYLELDLRDEKSIETLARGVGEVQILVNNAGASQIAAVEDVALSRLRGLFESNLFGLVKLTQTVLPAMRARRAGAIINVASFAGITPVPFLSVYAATKAALIALSRGLRQEVAPWGIRVAVIAPFDIHTTIPLEQGHTGASAYEEMLLTVRTARDRQLAEAPQPEVVARKVLQVLSARHPRLLNPVGRGASRTAFLVRHLPERIVESSVRKRFGLG